MLEDSSLQTIVGPLWRKWFQLGAEPQILLSYAELKVALRYPEEFSTFLSTPAEWCPQRGARERRTQQ